MSRHRWPVRLALAVAVLIVADLAVRWVTLLAPYPELDALLAQSASAVVTDRHGVLLQVTPLAEGMRRLDTPLGQIPEGVVRQFLQAEDRRFWLHGGVDGVAAARSAWLNLTEGRTVTGASTITMQLARLVHSRGPGWGSKLAEAWDALKLEARLGKPRILELWLDHLPFSSRLAGVEAAALGVFGTPLEQLTAAQAALLAVIPRRPALYDPRVHPEAAVEAALRLLPARDALQAAAALSAQSPPFPREAPHYVLWLAETTPGGLKGRVVTTLDLGVQQTLEVSIRQHLAPWYANRLRTGAGLVLDNVTGEVRAWVGSADFDDEAERGQIDGVLAPHQPGSTLKPFLYALALEKGFTPATLLPDLPTDFGSAEIYSPTNFNGRFNGPVRLRVALASSLNVPAVNALNRLGVRAFESWLGNLGFASLEGQKGRLGVGLALGNAEVSLRELVSAFAVFPRGGLSLDGRQVVSATTAGQIRDILSDQPSRFLGFGSSRVLSRDYTAMFKTGTANQYQHVWALGATPAYTLGLWMGNFRGETVIGRTGSGIPARALVEVLDSLTPADVAWPPVPASHVVRICTLSGMAATDNCPSTTDEFLAEGQTLTPCSWHRADGVHYPAEYAAWLRGGGRTSVVLEAGEAVPGLPLEILSPASGAVFFVNPQKPLDSQAIGVKVQNGAGATYRLDGRPLGVLDSTGRGRLPPTLGAHRLEVTIGSQRTFATYEVR